MPSWWWPPGVHGELVGLLRPTGFSMQGKKVIACLAVVLPFAAQKALKRGNSSGFQRFACSPPYVRARCLGHSGCFSPPQYKIAPRPETTTILVELLRGHPNAVHAKSPTIAVELMWRI